MPRLENWSVCYCNDYDSFEDSGVLRGQIYDDDKHKFVDGEYIHTTLVVKAIDDNTIETYSGTHYTLGVIDPEYEKLYPNAKVRMIKSLRKNNK